MTERLFESRTETAKNADDRIATSVTANMLAEYASGGVKFNANRSNDSEAECSKSRMVAPAQRLIEVWTSSRVLSSVDDLNCGCTSGALDSG